MGSGASISISRLTLSLLLFQLQPGISVGMATTVEVFLTMQLVVCIFAVTDERRNGRLGSAALSIGFSVTIAHLMGVRNAGRRVRPSNLASG